MNQSDTPDSVATLAHLSSAATSLAAASTSIASAINVQTQKPHLTQLKRAGRHLARKFSEGLALGVVVLLLALLDKAGTFVRFAHENFTQMPPIAIVIGVVGGYTYALSQTKTGPAVAVARAWLDLVQQFFTLGAGAFWLIKFGLALRVSLQPTYKTIPWDWNPTDFYVLVVGALLIGTFWELKDDPIAPSTHHVARVGILFMFFVIILFLISDDGGAAILHAVAQAVQKWCVQFFGI